MVTTSFPLKQKIEHIQAQFSSVSDSLKEDEKIELILNTFLEHCEQIGLNLYEAQEDAILEIMAGSNVILNTPTGSGKSMVALAMHFKALALGQKSYYTCPIKALVNEKFFALCKDFGPDQVGLVTGDASVNSQAPIICCTAEILSNIALGQGDQAEVDYVIMDEFHYYSDRDRGVAWQIPLITMPQSRFLLMSATMGDVTFFQNELTKLTNVETKWIKSETRPVPLTYKYVDYPLEETLDELIQTDKAPIYLVHFTQRECAQSAFNLLSVNFCSKEEKSKIADFIKGEKFTTPYGKEFNRIIRHGIGIHHAGLLPRYRFLVERLAQKGLLKIICGTDTLGIGINIPLKTVIFLKMFKYNGEKLTILSTRDFHQIAGRAGRKGYDDSGHVIVMAPEHVIKNKKQEQKAKEKGKGKKIVKSKPPEKNHINWNQQTFERIIDAPMEELKSSFSLSYNMILSLLSRDRHGAKELKKLIMNCHEKDIKRKRMKYEALKMLRSLLEKGIIQYRTPPFELGNYFQVNVDLQEDFNLNNTLSLYFLDTLEQLDPTHEQFPFRVLGLVESILENPLLILRKQEDKAKKEALYELKILGVDFDKRMEELEKISYPKPMSEFIYGTFNIYTSKYPWIEQQNIRPKSIAREMYEHYYSFQDYISEYNLERSEGLLLRYLSEVYKTLTQILPDSKKDERLLEVIEFFEQIIRQTDSSLLDEWEKLKDPERHARKVKQKEEQEEIQRQKLGILADLGQFERLIRNKIFSFIRALSFKQYERALEFIDSMDNRLTAHEIEEMMSPFYDDHEEISLMPNARSKEWTSFDRYYEDHTWLIRQTLVDTEGHNDFAVYIKIPLDQSKSQNRPVFYLEGIRQLAESDEELIYADNKGPESNLISNT